MELKEVQGFFSVLKQHLCLLGEETLKNDQSIST